MTPTVTWQSHGHSRPESCSDPTQRSALTTQVFEDGGFGSGCADGTPLSAVRRSPVKYPCPAVGAAGSGAYKATANASAPSHGRQNPPTLGCRLSDSQGCLSSAPPTRHQAIFRHEPSTTCTQPGSVDVEKHTCAAAFGSGLTGACGAAPFSAGGAALTGCAPSMSMGMGEGWLMLLTYVCITRPYIMRPCQTIDAALAMSNRV